MTEERYEKLKIKVTNDLLETRIKRIYQIIEKTKSFYPGGPEGALEAIERWSNPETIKKDIEDIMDDIVAMD